MVKYYKDFTGSTASITIRENGSALLCVSLPNGKRIIKKEYKSEKSAYSAWYRFCNS